MALRFTAIIEEARGGGAAVAIPADVVDALGGKARIAVNATFDELAYRGSVVKMGGRHIIGVLKAIRQELAKGPGDSIEVTLELDTVPRTVEVPPHLARALATNAAAKSAFDKLSYSRQREYVNWVNEAKKEETKERRSQKAVERILGS